MLRSANLLHWCHQTCIRLAYSVELPTHLIFLVAKRHKIGVEKLNRNNCFYNLTSLLVEVYGDEILFSCAAQLVQTRKTRGKRTKQGKS